MIKLKLKKCILEIMYNANHTEKNDKRGTRCIKNMNKNKILHGFSVYDKFLKIKNK